MVELSSSDAVCLFWPIFAFLADFWLPSGLVRIAEREDGQIFRDRTL